MDQSNKYLYVIVSLKYDWLIDGLEMTARRFSAEDND